MIALCAITPIQYAETVEPTETIETTDVETAVEENTIENNKKGE